MSMVTLNSLFCGRRVDVQKIKILIGLEQTKEKGQAPSTVQQQYVVIIIKNNSYNALFSDQTHCAVQTTHDKNYINIDFNKHNLKYCSLP